MQKVLLGGIAMLLFVAVVVSGETLENPSPALLDTAEYIVNQDAALLNRAAEREFVIASSAESNRHAEAVLAEANRHREEMAFWRTLTVIGALALGVIVLGAALIIIVTHRRMAAPVRGLMAQADDVLVIEGREVDDFGLVVRERGRIGGRR